MSEHALMEATQVYFFTALALGIVGVVAVVLASRATGHRRTILLLGSLPAVAMVVAYLMMGLEVLTVEVTGTDREQSVVRFLSYTAVFLGVLYVLKDLIGLATRQYVTVTIPLLLVPWMAFVSWITTGVFESLASGTAILSYLIAAYLLYVPVAAVARDAGAQRRLLYMKVAHLAVLCWGTLILTSGLSEQSAGLLDFFVGQFIASYVDVLFVATFAALVYNNRSLFDERMSDLDSEDGGATGPTPDSDGILDTVDFG